jgi:hypothetical protein
LKGTDVNKLLIHERKKKSISKKGTYIKQKKKN